MDARRVLLVAIVCLGVAAPVAQAQVRVAAAQAARVKPPPAPVKPWTEVRGFGRVLDLTNPPVVIDEPGHYAIDRDWRISAPEGVAELIQITADNVALDV